MYGKGPPGPARGNRIHGTLIVTKRTLVGRLSAVGALETAAVSFAAAPGDYRAASAAQGGIAAFQYAVAGLPRASAPLLHLP